MAKKNQKEIKKPPVLFKETQDVIQKIEQELNGEFISFWVSRNSRITGEDVVAFYKILKERQLKDKLFLFIKSDGGSGKGSLRIINLLRQFF